MSVETTVNRKENIVIYNQCRRMLIPFSTATSGPEILKVGKCTCVQITESH